jgi:uncharacterized protein YjiS (DUF1127 family)
MEVAMSVVPMAREFRVPEETSALSRAAPNLVGLAARVAEWIAREVAVRRDMRRLALFDDHMLHDIGIARADIEGAVRRGHDGSGDEGSFNPPPSLIVLATRTGRR